MREEGREVEKGRGGREGRASGGGVEKYHKNISKVVWPLRVKQQCVYTWSAKKVNITPIERMYCTYVVVSWAAIRRSRSNYGRAVRFDGLNGPSGRVPEKAL